MTAAEMGHADVTRTILRMLEGEWSEVIDDLPRVTRDNITSGQTAARLGFLHALVELLNRTEPTAPVGGNSLYRDRAGDLWMVGSDGVPYMIDGKRTNGSPDVWIDLPGMRSLAAIEAVYGPLHVVPWPGEVR